MKRLNADSDKGEIAKMKIIAYISNLIIPFFLFFIVGTGIAQRREIYEDFLEGAEDGLRTIVKIMPTLIGLMVAVGVLRSSGFLDFLGGGLGQWTEKLGFSGELVPLAFIRLFSTSAATGLLLDLFRKYGADSQTGWMAALILGATESAFYCMSVYFGLIKIRKISYSLVGALLASLVGIAAAVGVVQFLGVWV